MFRKSQSGKQPGSSMAITRPWGFYRLVVQSQQPANFCQPALHASLLADGQPEPGQYLASRIYPTLEDSLGAAVFGEGPVELDSLDVWELNSIWDERG
jgi:hypothetical protein